MATRLIWMTPGSEKLITYIARVSNPVGQLRQEHPRQLEERRLERQEEQLSEITQQDTRLVKYLIKNHFSCYPKKIKAYICPPEIYRAFRL